jgi:hypothetical protein
MTVPPKSAPEKLFDSIVIKMSCERQSMQRCKELRYSCEWSNEGEGRGQCLPIGSNEALAIKRQEQIEAKGGWYRIMLIFLVVIIVLFMAIQNALGINVFDALMSGNTTNAGMAGSAIIILVILGALYAFYTLLKKCDFSFACFLLGGEAGLMEQPVDQMRSQKYKKDMLKAHFVQHGQDTTYNGGVRKATRQPNRQTNNPYQSQSQNYNNDFYARHQYNNNDVEWSD